jgi:glycosyltransferase involved in cell wall biosynthesis
VKLLAVTTCRPWTARDGIALRVAALLRELGNRWDICLVVPSPPGAKTVPPSDTRLAELVEYPLTDRWALLPSQYDVKPLIAAVAEARRRERPAAALLWPGTEFLARSDPEFPPAVGDHIDCLALVQARQMRVPGTRILERIRSLRLLISFAAYERRSTRALTETVLVGQDDARVIRWLSGRRSVHVIPNGVMLGSADAGGEDDVPTVIFTGTLGYPPNIEAVAWFVRNVWPIVRARAPGARFVVAGRNPGPDIRALNAQDDIEVWADVEDMTRALRSAWVAVAPMRTGAGIKNKVLEAWAAARPVVMTRVAANGLRLDATCKELVANNAKDQADLLVRLLKDANARHRYGSAGRAVAERRHSWSEAGAAMHALLAAVAV